MHPQLSDTGLDTALHVSSSEEQTELYCRLMEGGSAGELLWLYPHANAGNGAVCSFFARLLD